MLFRAGSFVFLNRKLCSLGVLVSGSSSCTWSLPRGLNSPWTGAHLPLLRHHLFHTQNLRANRPLVGGTCPLGRADTGAGWSSEWPPWPHPTSLQCEKHICPQRSPGVPLGAQSPGGRAAELAKDPCKVTLHSQGPRDISGCHEATRRQTKLSAADVQPWGRGAVQGSRH